MNAPLWIYWSACVFNCIYGAIAGNEAQESTGAIGSLIILAIGAKK